MRYLIAVLAAMLAIAGALTSLALVPAPELPAPGRECGR